MSWLAVHADRHTPTRYGAIETLMQLTWNDHGDWVEAHVTGLLDNEAAEPLFQSLNELVRRGHHRLLLNLSGVNYLSSAGIATLLRLHKQLTSIRGFFAVCDPQPETASILRLTRLDQLLVRSAEAARTFRPATSTMVALPDEAVRSFIRDGMQGTVYTLNAEATQQLQLHGTPGGLGKRIYSERDVSTLNCRPGTFALGLGALGRNYSDCQDRFGEFMSAGGVAASQPTGGRRTADFQTTVGDFIPQVQSLYSMQVSGPFSHLIRFRGDGETPRLPLSSIIRRIGDSSNADRWGVVMLVETAGLVGASLLQSPAAPAAQAESESMFQHPEVRRWLSFAPEHVHSRSLALVVGVVARTASIGGTPDLSAWLRPLDTEGRYCGHMHAAVFGYRPIKKGVVDLAVTVDSLFESENLQAVLHLLHDRRTINGAGESELVSGACWFGPLQVQSTCDPALS